MVGDVLRLGVAMFSVSKPSGENPHCCGREQCQPEGFTVHVNSNMIFGVIFMMLSDSK